MKKWTCSLILFVLLGNESLPADDGTLVAQWTFDEPLGRVVLDQTSQIKDSLAGYFKYVDGVSGSCIRFDGYTTHVVRKTADVPHLTDSFSIQTWVALQALPWNWTAIFDQGGRQLAARQETPPGVDLDRLSPGLIGELFGEADLTRPQGKTLLTGTDMDWTGGAQSWSARWRGYLAAPFTGDIMILSEADDGLRLLVNDQNIIDGWTQERAHTGVIKAVQGEKYPVVLMYTNNGDPSFLRLFWSWQGRQKSLIPIEAFGYSERDNWLVKQALLPPKPHEPEFESRIFFGVDACGRLGLKANLNGTLYECISEQPLPLLKWNQVTGTFDKNDGLHIYINGQSAGSLKTQGTLAPAKGAKILIGKSLEKAGPFGSERQASAGLPSDMVWEGLIDEVNLYGHALQPDQIKKAYLAARPVNEQPLQWSQMPAGPQNSPPRFTAVYTRLRYSDSWEQFWRVGDYPDILVQFDELPIRLIFWRGTSYGAAWITENGLWMGDQSLERVGPGKSPWGCAEHMSDKQTRYSSVRIVEMTDARIVLQWRYAVTDITYTIFDTDRGNGWGDWADEYYIIYPDGVAIRHQILWTRVLSHEWQETIVLNKPGTRPEDNIELNAMTLANMNGESKTYSWENGPPVSFSDIDSPNIQMTNLKSAYKPFIIFEPAPKIKPFKGAVRPEYSHFPWWNHWPVAQLPNDGRKAMGPDRPSHSSLSQSIEESQVIHKQKDGSYSVVTLVGMTDQPVSNLVRLARSWNFPAELKVTGGSFSCTGFDKCQRAYILQNEQPDGAAMVQFDLFASHESPVINPAFVIENWGLPDAQLQVDGKIVMRGKDFRLGHRTGLAGTDLILWLKMNSLTPIQITLSASDKL
jgi:hypothetical protein